jgi:hypothetical protein
VPSTPGHALVGSAAASIATQPALRPATALVARHRLAVALLVLAGLAFGCAFAGWTFRRIAEVISLYFFAVHDVPVLILLGLFFAVAGAALRNDWGAVAVRPIDRQRALRLAAIMVAIVCGVVWVGSRVACLDFGLALDEFMTDFDARIMASGRLLAPVAPEWRDVVPALMPMFRLELPDNALWSSAYLPVNAAIRAVFVLLGAPALAGVALAALAIIAVFAVARRLWPDRPDAAVVAAVLLACSSQFLITAMTPFAMTAHLALNMLWLWLFLRDTRTGHALAGVVAFMACGLHQVVFHPLFAAPFVVSLMRARRWRLASYYGAVYAVSGLFWILYWSLVLHAANVPMAQSADVGLDYFVGRIAGMVEPHPESFILLFLNLIRFVAWQSPLIVPLAAVGLLAGGKRNGTLVCLAAGMGLTLIAVLVLMPFQGHGWGYRYLHGFLGALSLMAAQGWIAVTDRASSASRKLAFVFAANVLVALFVLLPLRAVQVRDFVTPYASAVAAIERSDADVVIVDPTDIWYGEDLVRNDPFLRARPKVLSLQRLSETQLGELCRRYDVAMFDRDDARQSGIPGMERSPHLVAQARKLRDLARSLGCGRRLIAAAVPK